MTLIKKKQKADCRTNKKTKQAVHSDRAAASGHKCAQQTALGRHNCARAGRWPDRAMKLDRLGENGPKSWHRKRELV